MKNSLMLTSKEAILEIKSIAKFLQDKYANDGFNEVRIKMRKDVLMIDSVTLSPITSKLSRAITDNCVAFICEDLAVKNMMKNHHLSKSIASVGWSQFLTMVQYKMERAGKYFRKISRWYPSSQTCGCCGYKNTDVKDLGVRKWKCPKCGTWHDRDVNAQQNIYKIGAKLFQDEGIQIIGLPVTNKPAN